MWSFLSDLVRSAGTEHTVVLMEAEDAGTARRYRIQPSRMMLAWGGSLIGAGVLAGLLVAFTPLRQQIPGYGTEEVEQAARLNRMRVQALQDSLAAQRRYVKQLRQLITGRVDSFSVPTGSPSGRAPTTDRDPRGGEPAESGKKSNEDGWGQPLFTPSAMAPTGQNSVALNPSAGLVFPLSPPVTSGFPTRGFNAKTGHYGIDIAVSEGEYIRAVGDGYVVWADWTQDGGYTIAVQHANGYLSVYKHNKRLLKHIGDRVRAQEPLAVSGNTGAITTGPHLHFELWRNGLALSPRAYVAGW